MVQPRMFRLLAVSAGLIYAVAVGVLWSFTADDSYIVARYAENLVDFGALEFNPGERILAITSPLHAFVEAALYALSGATLPAYKLLSLALVLGAVALLMRHFHGDAVGRSMALVVVLLSPSVVLWTFGGLETPLLLLLATLLAVVVSRPEVPGTGRLCVIFLVAGLCFLSRHDSILFTAPLALHATVRARPSVGRMGLAVLVGAALPFAWLVGSRLYYGDILPTSFYVKMPKAADAEILRNTSYLAQNLVVTGLLPFGIWVSAVCRAGGGLAAAARARFRRAWGLDLGILAMLGYGLWVATAHMFFSFRYFVPYLPAAVLVLWGLHKEGRARRPAQAGDRRLAASFLVLALGLTLFQAYHLFHVYSRSMNGVATIAEYLRTGSKSYEEGMLAARVAVAEDIRRHWSTREPGRPPRIYTTAGGILPYAYREAYFLERLVSYRHRCELERSRLAVFADYVHFISPRHGRVDATLSRPMDRYELVASRVFVYDGVLESALVYYDPAPKDNPLPPTVDGACGG